MLMIVFCLPKQVNKIFKNQLTGKSSDSETNNNPNKKKLTQNLSSIL